MYNENIGFSKFAEKMENKLHTWYFLPTVLLFTICNWLLEVKKWQNLVFSIKKINIRVAAEQSLGSLTASLITPNRIGEYGAKAIYYKRGNRRKIMLLNLIGNMAQMGVTVFFGVLGLFYISLFMPLPEKGYPLPQATIVLLGTGLISIFIYFKFNKKIRGFYIDKIVRFINKRPLYLKVKNIVFSVLRYLVFSHQFYFLLVVFNVEVAYLATMSLIFSTYLLASVVPGLPFFDWLIKGSVALYIFSLIQVDELTIVAITLLMWLFNFGLPALLGSYFVLNFNLAKQK